MLTNKDLRGNITLALRSAKPLARVVELVDSLASGASARKGVRVRLPPRAPKAERQKNLEIERFRDFLLLFQAKMLRFYRSVKTGILEFINFLSTSLK